MRAFVYARVSKDEEGSASLESQLAACREFCRQRGYTVVAEFTESASAFAPINRRKVFRAMIERALQGECDVIVVWDLSRFARLQEVAVMVRSQLEKAGVRVESVRDPVSGDDLVSRVYRGLMELFAEVESLQISSRTKRGLMNAVRKGHWCFGVPFGYRVENKRLVPDPETAPVVQRLFTLAADGYTLKELERLTNIPKSTIQRILRSTVYAGEYVWRGIIIQTPALIDRETFDRVQAMLSVRLTHMPARTSAAQHPLAGLVYCACGARCLLLAGKSGRYRYYACKRRFSDECDLPFVNAEKLERALVQALFEQLKAIPLDEWERIVGEELQVLMSDLQRNKEALLRRQQAIQRKIEHLLTLLPQTQTARGIVQRELDKLATELQQIEAERTQVEHDIEVLRSSTKGLAQNLRTLLDDLSTYENLSQRERRLVLRAWVKRVEVRQQNKELHATAEVSLFSVQPRGGRWWDELRTARTTIAFLVPA
jgi:DNA invertase Pin-like site-specific DNA recombinase